MFRVVFHIEASDYVDIIGIAVNAFLAFWIVRTIQNKLTNKRVLKDHFIDEIKEIRSEYKTCLQNLYTNQTSPRRIIPWFKLMNIKVDDLMTLLEDVYGVEKRKLNPYQNRLRDLITNSADFNQQIRREKLTCSESLRSELIVFQQKHNKLFNDIIIAINDHE